MNKSTRKRIHVSDIPLSWLNARCLDLIAKYANAAYVHEKTFFSPISPNIILEITEHANSTSNPSLTNLFHKFKVELKAAMADRTLLSKVTALASDIDFELNAATHKAEDLLFQQARINPLSESVI